MEREANQVAMNETHVQSSHGHEENIDHQGNANLAVWLGLASLTFFSATFIASNVYLRGWNPSKFTLKNALLKDVPYWDTLLLLVSGILVLVAAIFYTRNKWAAFRGILAITTLSYTAAALVQLRLTIWFGHAGKQIATIYTPTAILVFLLAIVSVIMLAFAGWYSSYADKTRINQFFPIGMNVWLYTALFGIVVLLVEDVMTVGQFAAWCGLHA